MFLLSIGVLNTMGVAPCRAEIIEFGEKFLQNLWDLQMNIDFKNFSFNKNQWPYLANAGSYRSYKYITNEGYLKNVLTHLENVKDEKKEVLQSISNNFACEQYLSDVDAPVKHQFNEIKIKSMFGLFSLLKFVDLKICVCF